MLRAVNEGIKAYAPSGRLVFANDAAARLHGFADAAELIAGELEPPAEIRRALATHEAAEVELRVRRPSGEERRVIMSITPLLDAAGQLSLLICTGRDITERVHREEAQRFLAEATQLLAASLDWEATLGGIARIAVPRLADWCAVDLVNARTDRLGRVALMHSDPELLELVRARHRAHPDQVGTLSARALATGQSQLLRDVQSDLEVDPSFDDEARRLIARLGLRSLMVVPLVADGPTINGHPPIIGVLKFCTAESGRSYDEADLALAEELARRAATAVVHARLYADAQRNIRVRDTFLTVASHELKTPLAALLLQTQALERAIAAEPALHDRTAAMERQVIRLGALVDRLIDVARITAGRLELHLEDVALDALVREAARRHAVEAAQAGCALEISLTPVSGRWDRERLADVIDSLIANALKYGAGAPVTLSVERVDARARLTVRDHGIGIPAEGRERIFERYERLVSDRHFGGLGLGLFLVRQIVDALGGEISVTSAPGEGSSFTIDLPAHARAESHAGLL
jgi:PAS domain S-box-containing protein